MTQTLEWFQCKACGRRHRWQAEIAGTEVQCNCGTLVLCPEVEVFADPSASGTLADPEASGAAQHLGEDGEGYAGEALEGATVGQIRRIKGGGLFGMGPFGEMVFWMIGAGVGFALLIHAIVVQWPIYIVATVIWAPISFWKFRQKLKRWQGNRSLMRAIEEEFDTSA